ncbi:Uncharacterised protein [uncultured archaeon]|nr:Uncharacterised protein [uncultured archaeon]
MMIKLVLSRPEKLEKNFIESLKKSADNTVLVLSSKPYDLLKDDLVKVSKGRHFLFIDTIDKPSENGVIYLSGENLTSLSIAINQSQQSFTGKVTILFDSITNLAIRNNLDVLVKFFSFILYRSHEWDVDLVFVLPKGSTDEKLVALIKQSADKIEVR